MADKKKNARVWAAQYQQRPTVGDGTIFKTSWMRFYYLDEPIDGAVPYPGDEAMEKWVGSWDMTFDGGAKAGDASADDEDVARPPWNPAAVEVHEVAWAHTWN